MSHEKLLWAITKQLKELTDERDEYDISFSLEDNEAKIFRTAMELGIVDQEWFDGRLKATQVELFCELLYVVGLHHMKETIQKSLQD